MMNSVKQSEEYEDIFFIFLLSKKAQRLENKRCKKKRQFWFRDIFLRRDNFGICNTLYQELKYTLYQELKYDREYYQQRILLISSPVFDS